MLDGKSGVYNEYNRFKCDWVGNTICTLSVVDRVWVMVTVRFSVKM